VGRRWGKIEGQEKDRERGGRPGKGEEFFFKRIDKKRLYINHMRGETQNNFYSK
jgi:hypothetical protein